MARPRATVAATLRLLVMPPSKRIRPEDIPAPVTELCRVLARHGYRGWVVGGCLRDLLRGRAAADWDLATDARPEQVQAIFPRVIPTGIQHGTVTVRQRGVSYELTTLRGEGAYSDGRRPDSVEFVSDIHDDLGRRDFTINALAYDPVTEQLEDPYGGLDDLALRLIRAVGAPERRFGEDGLRVLRAARFAASLEFELEPATEAAIRPTLDTFRRVSAERVREEWNKALKAREPSRAFRVMRRTGILEVTYPELARLEEPVWERTLQGLDAVRVEPTLRLAALLFGLRAEPVNVAEWLVRYRYSNVEREQVVRLLQCSCPDGSAAWTAADVRRYARRVGRGALGHVGELSCVMARAHFGAGSEEAHRAERLRDQLAEGVRPETPLLTRELALSGRDLMQQLSLAPGPRVGKLLEALLDRALDDPALNTPERLLDAARALSAVEAHPRVREPNED
ncbi:MAG: tRNA nucleotidyltransferase [Myxococcaceae bacterium]|nr:tRNA nucleotidyltransferase [Myxococcaceae bacterium]